MPLGGIERRRRDKTQSVRESSVAQPRKNFLAPVAMQDKGHYFTPLQSRAKEVSNHSTSREQSQHVTCSLYAAVVSSTTSVVCVFWTVRSLWDSFFRRFDILGSTTWYPNVPIGSADFIVFAAFVYLFINDSIIMKMSSTDVYLDSVAAALG